MSGNARLSRPSSRAACRDAPDRGLRGDARCGDDLARLEDGHGATPGAETMLNLNAASLHRSCPSNGIGASHSVAMPRGGGGGDGEQSSVTATATLLDAG